MKWLIRYDGPVEGAIRWIRLFLSRYDTSRLEWVKINRGSTRYIGVYGRCWFPTSKNPFYRISCQIPGPFPAVITTRKTPLYRQADGSFPSTPAGCRRGKRFIDLKTRREWFRVYGKTNVMSADEGVVWIFAHEAFHYLKMTGQVDGRNTEIAADMFADAKLAEYRASIARQGFQGKPVYPEHGGAAARAGRQSGHQPVQLQLALNFA